MYPYLIIPFNSDLEWRCKHLESYSQLDESTLAFETNLRAASSEVNIQIHLKDNITPDRIERVLLVIDDCGFDDFKGYIVLCRPVSYSVTRMRFSEYVKMAEICYHYVRQMMSNAQIAVYLWQQQLNFKRNIVIRSLHCSQKIQFQTSELNTKRNAFMPASQRDEMIEETVQEYGLNEAEFENYIEQ
uniref:Late expression factor 11 n=1 Tax=Caenorhabditis tropicalis TaxID=1561998 RepID=A0A1I7T139_9PELO